MLRMIVDGVMYVVRPSGRPCSAWRIALFPRPCGILPEPFRPCSGAARVWRHPLPSIEEDGRSFKCDRFGPKPAAGSASFRGSTSFHAGRRAVVQFQSIVERLAAATPAPPVPYWIVAYGRRLALGGPCLESSIPGAAPAGLCTAPQVCLANRFRGSSSSDSSALSPRVDSVACEAASVPSAISLYWISSYLQGYMEGFSEILTDSHHSLCGFTTLQGSSCAVSSCQIALRPLECMTIAAACAGRRYRG